MKQTFSALSAGNLNLQLNELEVGEILSLAQLNPKYNEHLLSGFLSYALDDNDAPYSMTVQQRYFCLLHYLSAQKSNDLAAHVNINDYLHTDGRPWLDSITVEDISVRQMNGHEIEALEKMAEDLGDWMLGAMALQITYGEQLPYIQPLTNQQLAGNVIKNRFNILKKLGQDQLNELQAKFQQAEEQLATLVTVGFDSKGAVLYESKGGFESEPARFLCDSTFTGFTKQLFSAVAARSAEIAAELGNEFE